MQSKAEVFERIKRMAGDITEAFADLEEQISDFSDKVEELHFPNYGETQTIANNLALNYPDLPEQVRQFLECIAEGVPYENKVNGLALVAV